MTDPMMMSPKSLSRYDDVYHKIGRDPNQQHHDEGEEIVRHMGGRGFFLNTGARLPHRMGIRGGMAWLLPVGEARDYIDTVQVHPQGGGRYKMVFGRQTADQNTTDPEVIRIVDNVLGTDLRAVYERETGPSE